MMSLVAAIKQLLLRLASVSTVYTDQDCAAAPLHAVVIEDHLDQKARKLVRDCRDRPLLVCYSNEATPFLVRGRASFPSILGRGNLQRRGNNFWSFCANGQC